MIPERAVLLKELEAAAQTPAGRFDPRSYLGTLSRCLGVPVPARRRIAKAWLMAHRSWPTARVLELVHELVGGDSHEEKTLGLLILEGLGRRRRPFGPVEVDQWLDHLAGWAEVDSLCQSIFGAEDLLGDWPAWSGLIRRLAGDANINRRRAALVLLNRSCRTSPDPRLRELAFETIGRLKGEREIIISKAVSWLLRALIAHHREAVASYLEAEGDTLPKIAVREARAKLETGRKTARNPGAPATG